MRYRIALVLALLSLTCKKEPPPAVQVPTLALQAIDASCTEAWLKATTTEVPATIRLIRLTPTPQAVQTLQLTTADTLLIDEGLLPKRTYSYQLQKLAADSAVMETSPTVQLTTMDTTSHNFTWRIDTLGTHSSVLYDVAIINDTLVYAVGEIFHSDSSQNWTFFNLAKWNGREWTLHRVYYRQNTIIHTRWILAFAWNDIWITPYTHWDGTTWQEVPFDPIFSGVRTNKAWGTSSRDFYVVGDGGFIAHYDGTSWRRIESGTGADFQDLEGYVDGTRSMPTILAVASSPSETKLFTLCTAGARDTLGWARTQHLRGVHLHSRFASYVSGPGIWRNTGSGWREMSGAPATQFLIAVRGTSENNLFVVAWRGTVAHFGGINWHQYSEIPVDLNFERAAVSQHLMVAVGFTGGIFAGRAAVIIGRRSQ